MPVRLTPSMAATAPRGRWPLRFAHGLTAAAYLLATLCLLFACAPFSVRPDPRGLNFVAATPLIGTAGMPEREQFAAIAGDGYRAVVNLAPPGAMGSHRDEAELVGRSGMRYYSVPVDFAAPAVDDYRHFAAVMRDHAGERVFVHCQMNLRASTFVFLYRVIELGEDVDRAYDDVLRVWEPSPQWREFIRAVLALHKAPLPMALSE
jgi:protein tyrosine phosphatase (PTP) superfamily phosphohydrolase (DUF442 family)